VSAKFTNIIGRLTPHLVTKRQEKLLDASKIKNGRLRDFLPYNVWVLEAVLWLNEGNSVVAEVPPHRSEAGAAEGEDHREQFTTQRIRTYMSTFLVTCGRRHCCLLLSSLSLRNVARRMRRP
jgi:hypothetical protein